MLHRWSRAAASLVAALTLAGSARASAATVTVDGLRMDNRADQPLGADHATPAFSWRLSGRGAAALQTAYRAR